jgi:esterase/lipase superfamily enzyme
MSSRGQWEHPHLTEHFSHLLNQRGIPHHVDIWGHDMPHDWNTWHRQLDHYISHRLG